MGMVGALRPEASMTSDRVFFITLASNDFMRGRQTFFAQVVDGLDVVARLNQAPRRGTTAQDPYLLDPPVRILSVQVP
jgi:cyclophilin family peptidyl-prolyl cis-trans isomerase